VSITWWLAKNYLISKPITHDNVHLLDKILSLETPSIANCQSDTILLSSFGKGFKFVGREENMEMILTSFNRSSSLTKTIQGGTLDKKNVVLPFIAAAPGVGKSRMLKEVASEMSSHCFSLYVSFGNGTGLRDFEQVPILQSFIARMIFSALIHTQYRSDVFNSFLIKFFEHLKKPLKLVSLYLTFWKRIMLTFTLRLMKFRTWILII